MGSSDPAYGTEPVFGNVNLEAGAFVHKLPAESLALFEPDDGAVGCVGLNDSFSKEIPANSDFHHGPSEDGPVIDDVVLHLAHVFGGCRTDLDQCQARFTEQGRRVGQELRPLLAVHDPVVKGERQLQDRTGLDSFTLFIVNDPRGTPGSSDSENCRLSRIENRGSRVDPENTDVRDGNCSVGHRLGLGFPKPGS